VVPRVVRACYEVTETHHHLHNRIDCGQHLGTSHATKDAAVSAGRDEAKQPRPRPAQHPGLSHPRRPPDGDPFGVARAVLHNSDDQPAARDLHLIGGRLPAEFEHPQPAPRFSRADPAGGKAKTAHDELGEATDRP